MMSQIVPYLSYPHLQTQQIPVYSQPPQEKPRSELYKWYQSLQLDQEPTKPIDSAVLGIRQDAEGALMGALLGLIDSEFGLDIAGKYPLDGIGALLFYVLSIKDGDKQHGFATDYRNLSEACSTVLLFRKVKEKRLSGKKQSTDNKGPKVDPIAALGKQYGL